MTDLELHQQASLWVQKMDTLGKMNAETREEKATKKKQKFPEAKAIDNPIFESPPPETLEEEELPDSTFEISSLFVNINDRE